jgi:hypothetical protein
LSGALFCSNCGAAQNANAQQVRQDAMVQRLADKIADAEDAKARQRLHEMWGPPPPSVRKKLDAWVIVGLVLIVVLIFAASQIR